MNANYRETLPSQEDCAEFSASATEGELRGGVSCLRVGCGGGKKKKKQCQAYPVQRPYDGKEHIFKELKICVPEA